MEPHATYDDVNLIVRLYELRREDKLRKARQWFTQSFHVRDLESFNQLCPAGSEELTYFRMVTTHWEMVASFITSDVLNQELFFQSGRELLVVWERVRDIVPELRKLFKDPSVARNLEIVAGHFVEWLNRQSPETYQAFSTRVRGT